MTTFVVEQNSKDYPELNESGMTDEKIGIYLSALLKIDKYARFLKQPLALWMFVPCDGDGNPWIYPPTNEEWEWAKKDSTEAEQSFKQKEYFFKKAKERVLFEGFKVKTYANGWEYISCGSFTYLISSDNKLFDDNQNCAPRETKDTIEELLQCGTYLTLTATAIKSIYGS